MAPLYGRALLHWPLVLAVLTIFGTSAFVLGVAPAGDAHHDPVMDTFSPLWRVLAGVVALVGPVVLVVITADMAAVSWWKALPLLPIVVRETHVGRVWACFLAATIVLIAGTFLFPRHPFKTILLLVTTTLLLFLEALASHAIDHGGVAVVMYVGHELAAGVWLGALVGLWVGARHGHVPEYWVENTARRVSKLAAWCVLTLVLSGAYTAYEALGVQVSLLLFSVYGRILSAKIVLFGLVLILGAYNRYRLVPKVNVPRSRDVLVRNVGVESLLLLGGVLALASLLANTPPAHNHTRHAANPKLLLDLRPPFSPHLPRIVLPRLSRGN